MTWHLLQHIHVLTACVCVCVHARATECAAIRDDLRRLALFCRVDPGNQTQVVRFEISVFPQRAIALDHGKIDGKILIIY